MKNNKWWYRRYFCHYVFWEWEGGKLVMDRGLVLYKMNLKICFIKLNSLVVSMLRMLRNISYGLWIRWQGGGEVIAGNGSIKIFYFAVAIYPTCFHYIHHLCFSPIPKSSISSRRERREKAYFSFYLILWVRISWWKEVNTGILILFTTFSGCVTKLSYLISLWVSFLIPNIRI